MSRKGDKWKNRKWTVDTVLNEMKKYSTRSEFKTKRIGAYEVALELGLLDQIPLVKGRTGRPRRLSIDDVLIEARKYSSKGECQRENSYLYHALWNADLLYEVWPENNTTYNTRDCVYIWSVDSESDLYKVGVTSKSLGIRRIEDVSRKMGVSFTIVSMARVGTDVAKVVESVLKRAGVVENFEISFNGCTEFRRISPSELAVCVEIINEHTIERLI